MKKEINKKELVCKANKEEFNNEAETYDDADRRGYSKHQHDFFSDKIRDTLSLAEKKKTLKIIDFGCGTGVSTLHLLKHLKDSSFQLSCLDISEKTLNVLKNKLDKEQLKKIKFICDDATNYFEKCEETFDIIIVSGALHHIYDYLKLIEEAVKKLNSSGVLLIIGEPLQRKEYNYYLDQVLRIWDRAIFEKKGLERILYFLYAPFNFISPIMNQGYIRKLKFKILRKPFIKKEEDLIEYWGYEKGLDLEKIKEILSKSNSEIMEIGLVPSLVTNFLHKIEKYLGIKKLFYLISKKKN